MCSAGGADPIYVADVRAVRKPHAVLREMGQAAYEVVSCSGSVGSAGRPSRTSIFFSGSTTPRAVWIGEERIDSLRLLIEWPPGKLSP
jgi:hypothetical protein